jgi:hypothetical protein
MGIHSPIELLVKINLLNLIELEELCRHQALRRVEGTVYEAEFHFGHNMIPGRGFK